MAYRIATDLIDAIIADAAAAPDVEICGLLLGRGETVEEARPCRNVATDPARMFEIDPAALVAAHRAARAGGRAIMGCYHSHPTGRAEPSAQDAADAEANGWLWLIVAGGKVRGWRPVVNAEPHGRFKAVVLSE